MSKFSFSILYVRALICVNNWLVKVLICACVTVLSLNASARGWQLMLVPEQVNEVEGQAVNLTLNSNEQLPSHYTYIKQGLSFSLSQSGETLIDSEKLFSRCYQYLCAQQDVDSLMANVSTYALEVDLIVLFGFIDGDRPALNVRLIDPLSRQVRFTDTLRLVDELSQASLTALGQDMGSVIETRLTGTHPQHQYTLSFDNFLFDELNGLTTMTLTNSENTRLVLIESSFHHLFAQYLPVTKSKYTLLSSLSASQVRQMLNVFFAAQDIQSNITFAHVNGASHFEITRDGNPYMPSLITTISIFCLLIALLYALIRRRNLDSKLQEHAGKRNADSWLITYKKASFLFFGLTAKQRSQVSYWTQLQAESEVNAVKAKLYFDAGDMNTCKLFISKALHANTANIKANKLLQKIEKLETNSKNQSDNEQWIRNKLAKAMNSYRQQQPVEALGLLYQASALAKQDESLKKQAKALKKLISQFSREYAQARQSLVVSCAVSPQSILLCSNDTVHIGRRSSRDDATWISSQDATFYVNHKAVSRAGQHGFIHRQGLGYYWVDSGSKNGSYLDKEKATAHQPIKFTGNSLLYLGGRSATQSAAMRVELSPQEALLQLDVDLQSTSLLTKQELNTVWPDNALACKTKLVCVQNNCWIVLDTVLNKLHVCEVGLLPVDNSISDNKNAKLRMRIGHEKPQFVPVCMISLGKTSSITPIAQDKPDSQLALNEQVLLGEVPLFLPCTLRFNGIHIQLHNYDSETIRYNHEIMLFGDDIGPHGEGD